MVARLAASGLSFTLRQELLDLIGRDRPDLNVYALGREVGALVSLERAVELAVDVRLALLPRHGRPRPVRHKVNARRLVRGISEKAGEAVNAVAFGEASLTPAKLAGPRTTGHITPLTDPVANARVAALLIRSGRPANEFVEAALTGPADASKEADRRGRGRGRSGC